MNSTSTTKDQKKKKKKKKQKKKKEDKTQQKKKKKKKKKDTSRKIGEAETWLCLGAHPRHHDPIIQRNSKNIELPLGVST